MQRSGLFFWRFSQTNALIKPRNFNLIPKNISSIKYYSTKSEVNEEEVPSPASFSDPMEQEIMFHRKMGKFIYDYSTPIDIEEYNNVLEDLGKRKQYQSLRFSFENIPKKNQPNERTYKILIRYLAEAPKKNIQNYVQIFENAKKLFTPSHQDYLYVLSQLYDEPALFQNYFTEMERLGYTEKSKKLYNILIFYYGRRDNRAKVEELFEEVKNSETIALSTSIYNSMIRFYGESDLFDKVEEFYTIVKKGIRGVKPNVQTLNTLLLVYGQAGQTVRMEEIFKELVSTYSIKPNPDTLAITKRYHPIPAESSEKKK